MSEQQQYINPESTRTASEYIVMHKSTIETIEKLREENKKLRAFANEVLSVPIDADPYSIYELKKIAATHGLIQFSIVNEPCADCTCSEYFDDDEFIDGVWCFRKTELLSDE